MKRAHPTRQRGMTMLMVLILMSVMLLGSLALARMTESSTLISGNVAAKDGSVHAAEVGWNTAFQDVTNIIKPAEGTAIPNWYWTTIQPTDAATGIPQVNFDTAKAVTGGVGRYEVRYVVERMCTVASVTTSATDCLIKQANVLKDMSSTAPDLQPAAARQYRITVRVTDQRGTQTWTQSLVN